MSSNHEDPNAREIHEAQLTAYALGQLNAKEREATEALVARSEKTRQFVEETAVLASHVRQACQQAPAPEASASLRGAIEKRFQTEPDVERATLNQAKPVAPKRSRRKLLWVVGMAGCAACAMVALLLPAVQSARESARRISDLKPVRDPAYSGSEQTASAEPKSDRDSEFWYRDSIPGADSFRALKRLSEPKSSERGKDATLMARTGSDTPMGDKSLAQDPYVGKPPSAVPGDSQPKEAVLRSGISSELAAGKRGDVPGSYYMQDDVRYFPPPQKPYLPSSIDQSRENEGREISGPGYSPSPGTEQYDQTADNNFRSVARQPLSTFSIDVDTASYANVRRFLTEGRLPPSEAVRIEEMVNYFRYDYSPPGGQTPFSVHMETAECPWQPEHRLVRIGLKGREIDRHERGPCNFVFLLDVSGSMGEPNKLPLVKQAMRMLVEQLHADDRVAIVTYASGTDVRLPSTRGNERPRIIAAIEALQSGGCTYGSAGIELAYRQAQEHFVDGGVNRVILCTDGDLNVGITNDDDLVRLIEQKAKSGVFLTVLGFGTGNLKDGKLEKLADKGNGVYAYIDALREAHRVLVEQMTGSLITIAKDVKIQVEFNPAEVAGYRLVGYENRVMANRDFDNDRKDAGDIGAGHTVTALYEIVPARAGRGANEAERPLKYQRVPDENLTKNAQNGELLTLRLRYKEPEENESRLLEFTARDSGARFGRASPDFRFASAVAAFGMVLRGSPYRGEATLAAVEEYAAAALGKDPNGHRAEFLDLVRKAQSLSPGR